MCRNGKHLASQDCGQSGATKATERIGKLDGPFMASNYPRTNAARGRRDTDPPDIKKGYAFQETKKP
jgi:hypothetical protein